MGREARDLIRTEYRFRTIEAPAPTKWLSDNGSPYIAGDTRRFARELGLVPVTTPIESPQSNGMAEASVNTLRRDYVSVNPTPDAQTILGSLLRWIEHYNEHHPHSSLMMRSPRMVPARAGDSAVRVRVRKYGGNISDRVFASRTARYRRSTSPFSDRVRSNGWLGVVHGAGPVLLLYRLEKASHVGM